MKKIFLLFYFLPLVAFAKDDGVQPHHNLSEEQKIEKLVKDIKALDSAIVRVSPGRVREADQPYFKLRWSPTVTLRKDTSVKKQHSIARKLARYVVAFQGGVLTDKVYGGVLAHIEGERWHPELGTIVYEITSRKPLAIEVFANERTKDKKGRVSCCERGKKIGSIEDNRFR